MADIQLLSNLRCRLGEGPVWDAKEQALYLVDIEGRQIHRITWDKGSIRSWTLPSMIGCMALRASAGAIIALQDGFYSFDFVTGRCVPIAGKLHGSSEIRFNDGKTDRQGRFYAATMDMSAKRAIGNLYCLKPTLFATLRRGMSS